MLKSLLHWRLSSFYFFYFATIGALVPYWNHYLKDLGFNDAEIGELIAIVLVTKVVAPNVWGWIADHTGKRVQIVRLASLLSVICFAGVLFNSSYWWLAIVMLFFSFFWNASLPQVEAVTMNHLGQDTHHYNAIRIWGSVGFVIAVIVFGQWFTASDTIDQVRAVVGGVIKVREKATTSTMLPFSVLPYLLLVLFTGIWISSMMIPKEDGVKKISRKRPLCESLCHKNVIFLLLTTFLLQASHGPYYAFFTRYLEESGHVDKAGYLWAWAVVAEIIIFVYMHRLLQRFGARNLFLVAFALTTIRWLLIASVPGNLGVLILAQTLHAASFGVVHAVSIYLIHHYFTQEHQGRGQALYSSLSFGLGGAIGSLFSGYLWSTVGGSTVFYISATLSMMAFVLAWFGVERDNNRRF